MARRRTNGEGCISREPSGRIRISISVRLDGKLVRRTRTAWKMAAATAILAEMQSLAANPVQPERIETLTVAEFLQRWLADAIQGERAANTVDSYRRAVLKHISPTLGGHLVGSLAPLHVHGWLAEMARAKTGSRTRENAFTVLRAAMKHAVAMRLVPVNPCAGIAKPKHARDEIRPFTLDEARLILSETFGQRWHVAFELGLCAGLRQGEILGLAWSSVDFERQQVRVEQQATCLSGRTALAAPKTRASVRTVDLTPATMDALWDHRAIQMASGQAASTLVCPATEGGIASRGNFRTREWNPLLASLAIEPRGFHHTRHTYATLALGAGVPVTVVAKQLGHSKPSTTLDIYGHAIDQQRSAAVAVIGRLFG